MELRELEPLTPCLQSSADVFLTVPDMGLITCRGRLRSAWFGVLLQVVATGVAGVGPCHSSDRCPVNPCQDSGARVPKASRSDASVASALAADLAGLHDAGAGRMARRRDPAR